MNLGYFSSLHVPLDFFREIEISSKTRYNICRALWIGYGRSSSKIRRTDWPVTIGSVEGGSRKCSECVSFFDWISVFWEYHDFQKKILRNIQSRIAARIIFFFGYICSMWIYARSCSIFRKILSIKPDIITYCCSQHGFSSGRLQTPKC